MVGKGSASVKAPSPEPSPLRAGERGCYCAGLWLVTPRLPRSLRSLAIPGRLVRLY